MIDFQIDSKGFGKDFNWFPKEFRRIWQGIWLMFKWISKDLVRNLMDFCMNSKGFGEKSNWFPKGLVGNLIDSLKVGWGMFGIKFFTKSFKNLSKIIEQLDQLFWNSIQILSKYLPNPYQTSIKFLAKSFANIWENIENFQQFFWNSLKRFTQAFRNEWKFSPHAHNVLITKS